MAQNEFSLIDNYFKSIAQPRDDVIFGIGDDAACLRVPENFDLLVSTDSLVSGVHFLPEWDAYDIAYKAVMVNVSDIAAMAGKPSWVSLALTIPEFNAVWLTRFSLGLKDALNQYQITLIGGDTTRGPLSITLTIHGFVPKEQAVRRNGAKVGDSIFISGVLGAAALAVEGLKSHTIHAQDQHVLMQYLHHPVPRVDLVPYLRKYASAAIDISDGLAADLYHICKSSHVGACLEKENIPIHALLHHYRGDKALELALHGGDDYQLCFTVPASQVDAFNDDLKRDELSCYFIGKIEEQLGLRLHTDDNEIIDCKVHGYSHF